MPALGPVTQTHWQAAHVEISQATSAPVRAYGFGRDARQAFESALARALSDLMAQVAGGAGPIEIVIDDPWPAMVVRQLEHALRTAVAGVHSASLSALRGDGKAIVSVNGPRDAAALLLAIGELSLPAATIEKAEVRAPRQLGLRLRMRPDAAETILQSMPDEGQTSEPPR